MTRLKLSRETLRQLSEDETPKVVGGMTAVYLSNCYRCVTHSAIQECATMPLRCGIKF